MSVNSKLTQRNDIVGQSDGAMWWVLLTVFEIDSVLQDCCHNIFF